MVLETTNHIYDFSILRDLSPATVPSWLRVRTANLLASNGSAWVDSFRRYNSGTYNNQARDPGTELFGLSLITI